MSQGEAAEVYVPWKPLGDGTPDCFELDGLDHGEQGLRLRLKEDLTDNRALVLTFESAVAYRNINESYRQRTWNARRDEYRPSLLLIRHSTWVRWLRHEAAGVLDGVELVHYAVLTDEYFIEVVTQFPPEVSWREAAGSEEAKL